MSDELDCFIQINDLPKMPFWLDKKCNSRRLRQCLWETLNVSPSPLYSKIYIKGKLIDDDTIPLMSFQMVKSDVIKIVLPSNWQKVSLFLRTLNDHDALIDKAKPIFASERCRTCNDLFSGKNLNCVPVYLPCNHVVFCSSECIPESGPCPICLE